MDLPLAPAGASADALTGAASHLVAARRALQGPAGAMLPPVSAAARSGLFDAIGHLDVVKRYLAPHVTPAQLAAAPELFEPALVALVESDTALEVNTSGLRQAAAETYPGPGLVARFRELGGTRLTAGSDAHREHAFAFGLDAGYRVASEAGFGELSFRRGGGPVAIPIPDRARA